MFATQRVDDLQIHPALPQNSKPISCNAPQIPGYEILEILGEGTTGIVYRARQLALNRLVAVKMIGGDHFGTMGRQRFDSEAQIIARLHHPNFVQIFEVGEYQGRPYLVLELVEGGTLGKLLASFSPMPVKDAVRIVAQLARAMHFAHEKGVIHRDLKPANILLAKGETSSQQSRDASLASHRDLPPIDCKITDFGLAKILDAAQAQTRTGAVMGTPAYMAPEQAIGRLSAIGPATDVYALGVILYEMLAGKLPFNGANPWDVLVQIVEQEPAPPSQLRARLARDLDTICLKALAKDPKRRYASAAELADDLERFAGGEAIEARPESAWQQLIRRVRRRPFLLAASVFMTGMMAFLAVLFSQQSSAAQAALNDGRQLRHEGYWSAAIVQFKHGQQCISSYPGCDGLRQELSHELRMAMAGQWAADLHVLADRMRLRQDADSLSPEQRLQVARQCRQIFDVRETILELRDEADAAWQTQVVRDLFDVALLGSRLEQNQSEPASGQDDAVRIAQQLEDAGADPAAVARLKEYAGRLLGKAADDGDGGQAVAAWSHYLMGRTLRISGNYSEAAKELDKAIVIDPRAAVFHFEAGLSASHLQNWVKAQQSYTTCIALVLVAQPDNHQELDVCYYNRGLANLALDQAKFAEADFTQALTLNPSLGAAWFHRGLLARERRQLSAAANDLHEALRNGFSPGQVHYELAIICRDQGDLSAAVQHVESARQFGDCPPNCAQLDQELRKDREEHQTSKQ
jgi:serine/threonine protein kinase